MTQIYTERFDLKVEPWKVYFIDGLAISSWMDIGYSGNDLMQVSGFKTFLQKGRVYWISTLSLSLQVHVIL